MVRCFRVVMVVEVLDATVEATKVSEKNKLFKDAVARRNNKQPKGVPTSGTNNNMPRFDQPTVGAVKLTRN